MQKNFQIVSASVSDRGLSEKRPENEDSYVEIPNSGIFAVADGVGGAQAGDVASQMAMEIIGEAFTNLASPGDAEDVMKTAIERANEAIFQMSNELPQLSTMATTVVALHLNGYIATIGHVGDSRLYRIDSNGTLYRETQDHSVVEEEVRAGRMTPEQAANHPSRNIISRALGAEPSVEVDLKTIMFEPNTTFLVCSDGITRHITDDEINALLFSTHQPAEICQRMKEICYDRGAEDNLTAVIVRIFEAGTAVSSGTEDFEQDTIATARPTIANFSASEDFETQKLDLQQVSIPAEQPKTENYSSEYIEASKSDEVADERNRTEIRYDEEKSSGGGFFGKLLGGLLLLILGVVLGAYGYKYLIKQEVIDTPPIVDDVPKTNVASETFLDLIEDVDENPDAVILASQNTADSPEEFYLLGRAQMLKKNYAEAKKNLIQAKDRLAMADKENVKTLTTEIAMGLAIINDPFALKEFEKELPAMQTGNSNANSNVSPIQNSNSNN
jgi:protein phosphatase